VKRLAVAAPSPVRLARQAAAVRGSFRLTREFEKCRCEVDVRR
jgi:hypothetical protein